MQNSKVIEINGVFVGAAVRLEGDAGWLVVAADSRVNSVDGCVAASLDAAKAVARRAYMSAPATAAAVAAPSAQPAVVPPANVIASAENDYLAHCIA